MPTLEEERALMLSGEWYRLSGGSPLIQETLRARRLCQRYNACDPGDHQERERILADLLGAPVPVGLMVFEPVWFDYGWATSFGEHTFVNHGCQFVDGGGITMGSHVLIGPNCGLYTAEHPLDEGLRAQGVQRALPITIGDHCWLGGNVTVCPGVTIGEGSVVAAGAVVTRDVPPRTLVVGVPAKVVRDLG